MLLNESLSRLSRGTFEIDEYGNFDAPDHDDAEYAYGKQQTPDIAYLATKYRELWEDVPAELLVDEEDRAGTAEVFPELAAAGSLGYPSDLSSGTFDDLDDDRLSSEVYQSEVRLLNALVDFHTRFHGWRLFAEEHLDTTLDELLQATQAERSVLNASLVRVDEETCRDLLGRKGYYLTAYEEGMKDLVDAVREKNTDTLGEVDTEKFEEFVTAISDLDTEVDEAVEEMAAQFDYAI